MPRRSVLVCNPTAQIRTNVDVMVGAFRDDERTAVTLLTVASDDDRDGTVDYTVTDLPLLNYTIPGVSFLLALAGVLGDADTVVVAEYEYLSSVIAVVAATLTGKRVVLSTDAVLGVNWFYGNRLVDVLLVVYTHTLGVLAFNLADDVVVLCADHRADVRRLTVHDDVHVIPNGVDTDHFAPRGDAPTGRSVTEPVDLLFVGRLDPVKGLDLLVEAVATLSTDLDVRLHLVGSGADEERLRSLCERHMLTDVVRFHGWQAYVEPYYERADVFVLSSRSEGQPTVVLEAQAAGVPVVSTDVGCVRELVGGGAVVGGRDPNRFAAAVRAVLNEDYATLRQAGRDHVVANFERRRTARRYVELVTGETPDTVPAVGRQPEGA